MSTPTVEWPDRMNPTDALFWSMDKIPELRSTIGALVLLERAPTRERMRAEFERLSHALPRLRQQVVEVPWALAPPEWVDDPQFDLDYHLRYVAVPAPSGIAELLDELGPLYATAFDRDRPLWEAYVAEGLLDGRGAVFVKMHHCVTDGVGGSRLFAELLSACAEPTVGEVVRVRDGRATTPAALLARAAWYNLEEGVKAGVAMLRAAAATAFDPRAGFDGVRAGVRAATGFGRELVVSRADSPLHQRRSLSRKLSTFEMALADIEAVRRPLNATINDIVLTIVSGAMHRWHTSRGADVHELRALVPVNLRGAEDLKAGNRLALLAVSLPVGEPNPLRRLSVIQDRIGHVKTDRRATMYPLLARLVVALPLAVAEQLVRQQTSRTNFVCTNVPGPARTCYLAGEPIERIYAFAPLVGDHPVAIALYSYRDVMCVGLDIDSFAMHDLAHFRDALQEAYDEMLNVGRHAEAMPKQQRARRRKGTRKEA
jgi:diacylglycerol O-acyltransferase / wax synthase